MDSFLFILISILIVVLCIKYYQNIKEIVLIILAIITGEYNNTIYKGGGCYDAKLNNADIIVDTLNIYNKVIRILDDKIFNNIRPHLLLQKVKGIINDYNAELVYKLLVSALLKSTTGKVYLVYKDDHNNLFGIIRELFNGTFFNAISMEERNRLIFYNISYDGNSLSSYQKATENRITAFEKYQEQGGKIKEEQFTKNETMFNKIIQRSKITNKDEIGEIKVVKEYFNIEHGKKEIDDNFIIYLFNKLKSESADKSIIILSFDKYQDMINYLPDNYIYCEYTRDNFTNPKKIIMNVNENAHNVKETALKIDLDNHRIEPRFTLSSDNEFCVLYNINQSDIIKEEKISETANSDDIEIIVNKFKKDYLLWYIFNKKNPEVNTQTLKTVYQSLRIYENDKESIIQKIFNDERPLIKEFITDDIIDFNKLNRYIEPINQEYITAESKGTVTIESFLNKKELSLGIMLLKSIVWLQKTRDLVNFNRLNFIEDVKLVKPSITLRFRTDPQRNPEINATSQRQYGKPFLRTSTLSSNTNTGSDSASWRK